VPSSLWFPRSAVRRAVVPKATVVVAVSLLVAFPADSGQSVATPPRVVVAEYDGIIHPIAAEFVDDLLTRAATPRAELAVLILRTPGGLLESTRTIVSRLLESPVPVVVFISPAGARAASAGFLITLAADVAVMSSGTHIGAAHPVSASGGEAGNETMTKKAAADTAAYARTLAQGRQRNAALAAEAVTESRAFTEREALEAVPPLIDLAADDLDALLRQLDGRIVRRFDGRAVTVRTAGAVIERVEPTWRQTVLSTIAHPQLAYLLFTLGMLGLVVEFWNPGFVLPGVAGGLCLLLAVFAFQILPIDVTGLLLVLFGMALLGAEVMVPSFGILGIGGIAALLAGSLMITREVPGIIVGWSVILPAVGAAAVIVIGLGRLAVGAQRRRPHAAKYGLVGMEAESLAPLGPHVQGQVRVRGEIWRAVADVPVPAGRTVRVAGVDGLTLHVRPSDEFDRSGGPR
jgi:membrane-bound serine protease (ClpP class)